MDIVEHMLWGTDLCLTYVAAVGDQLSTHLLLKVDLIRSVLLHCG
jgi:hypothetical protein